MATQRNRQPARSATEPGVIDHPEPIQGNRGERVPFVVVEGDDMDEQVRQRDLSRVPIYPGEDPDEVRRGVQEALSLAGAWSELNYDEMMEALDRIRHTSKPTPLIDDL